MLYRVHKYVDSKKTFFGNCGQYRSSYLINGGREIPKGGFNNNIRYEFVANFCAVLGVGMVLSDRSFKLTSAILSLPSLVFKMTNKVPP
jgi:hypothetical protein